MMLIDIIIGWKVLREDKKTLSILHNLLKLEQDGAKFAIINHYSFRFGAKDES